MATCFFLVGLVASGKSTWAENNKDKLNAVIHSSDSIREELGNINDQSQNELVFNILHKRVKEDLLNGNNVIYDATNLKRKNRRHLIDNVLRDIPCKKICVLFATPYEICLKNNASRDRTVPEHVLKRMYLNYEAPCKQEGFDDIQLIWWDYKKDGMKFDLFNDLNMWRYIDHDNPHHTLSIGDHMIAAKDYLVSNYEYDNVLYYATLLHDCGKPFTKAFLDSKGEKSDTAHFYQHHCCGSYLSMFYLKELDFFTNEDILHMSLLIELHMRHFLSWKQSDNAKDKDRKLFGDDILSQVEILHMCDVFAKGKNG